MAEKVPNFLAPKTASICEMLIIGCQDQSTVVAIEAMQAATLYIDAIATKEIVMQMKPVLQPILTVLSKCLERGDEDMVIEGLEIFQECGKMEFPLINDILEVKSFVYQTF